MPSTTIQIRAEDKTKAAFRQINDRTQKLKKSFSGLAGAAVSLAGVAGLGALTSKLLTLGDRIGKVSIQTGVSAEKLQAFQFAAEQSGVGAELMNKSLQKLNRNIGEAAEGTGPAAEALDALGVSALTSSGQIKSTEVIFQDIARAFGDVESDALRAKIASDLFGRAGVELIPLLSAGAGGVDYFGKQIESVGGIINEDGILKIQEFNDKVNLLTKAFRGFLADSGTFEFLGKIIDGWTFGVQKLNEKFGVQEKKVRDIATISADLKLTRKESALFQSQIEKSTGNEREEAIKRLQTNQKQIKALQAELLKSEKIEGSVKDQEKAQKKVKKAIQATDKVAKDLKKTVKPLMIAGKLDVPAIGGRKGLGGTLGKFVEFYLNLMTLAEDYLGTGFGTAGIVKKHLKTIKQDFTEMITALQNQIVFKRNDISDAFADILSDFKDKLEETKIDVENINIEIPSSAFDFTNTFAKVPGEIFDFSAVKKSAEKIDSLVRQINSYSVSSRTVSREAMAVSYASRGAKPYWSNANLPNMQNLEITGRNNLKYDVPSISSSGSTSRSSSRSSMSSGSSALTNSNSPTINVNIYDGTGQKINAYDSAIRVEINERASRFNEFPAMAV